MNEKLDRLRKRLTAHAPLVVAYSSGVDSACLLVEAHQAGLAGAGAIADSPSLPRESLAEALALAGQIGVRVKVMKTGELDNPDYRGSGKDSFKKSPVVASRSMIPGSLFLGEPTRDEIGYASIFEPSKGRRRACKLSAGVAGSSQAARRSGGKITGMRSWIGNIGSSAA
jgi:hypothetical protein